jgi:hypothetical protein
MKEACARVLENACTVNGACGSLFILTALLGLPFCVGFVLALNLLARLALRGSCCVRGEEGEEGKVWGMRRRRRRRRRRRCEMEGGFAEG